MDIIIAMEGARRRASVIVPDCVRQKRRRGTACVLVGHEPLILTEGHLIRRRAEIAGPPLFLVVVRH